MIGKYVDLDERCELTNEVRVKIANLNEIEAFAGTLKPDPAYMYLHVIAMGAGEYYGPNKNGDFFPERALIAYHHTFEESAKVHKEHRNKREDPKYGFVPKSWYNPTMHRVELVLAVDKKAAPDIVARVEAGEVPGVSMGCKVPHDVCSICGNKAAKKDEYCSHIKYENKKIYPDGRQACMLNLQPTFFDISFVRNPADKQGTTLRKIASSNLTNLDHVFDVTELDKKADVDKEMPAEAVVKVLNKGFNNILPKLEKTEPDLPIAMLDSMASRFSLKDILTSFLHNYTPMKPTEVTRIIIVQNRLPHTAFSEVLRGVMSASPCRLELGEYQPSIGAMLNPFLPSRSSYGPHVVERVIKVANNSQQALNDILLESDQYRYLYPDVSFYNPVRQDRVPVHEHPYSTIPAMYTPQEYVAKKREPLREPISPFKTGLIMAATYAAYRSVQAIKALGPGGLALGAAAAGLTAVAALDHASKNSNEKTAGAFVNKVVLPFVGAHLLSAHYRRKYYQGEQLNDIESAIANNPDYLSIAAPIALHFGGKKVNSMFKGASEEESKKFKLANFTDTLLNSAIQGIIFRGRGLSATNNMADLVADNFVLDKAIGSLAGEDKPTQPKPATLKNNFRVQ